MKKFLRSKRLFAAILAGTMVFSTMGMEAFAAQKLYDQVATETVTKGVTYEFNHRLTAEGWQDIHVLKVDLNDPNLGIAPIESTTEYGLKETVLKIVADNGAVAGVNADFFGMKGKYSASFGPVVREGEVISAGTDRNIGKNEYATFFLDEGGNPFIDYFNIKADFYANTNSHLELASLNKITEMIYPIYFDKNAAKTTADLDKRFPNLVKLIVEDDIITRISGKGETVEVPENGYLIIMNGPYYDGVSSYFVVGQKADLQIRASLDLDNIQTTISGAGKILSDGQQAANPGLVIGGRQPRTALGISQDKSTLILMVVDGRTHSIGATQAEMATLMKEYGAHNAMHLDGGGSSTMVAKTIEKEKTEVKNTVSDGAQRKVMNAVGIFNKAPIGEVAHIVIKPSAERVFVGNDVSFAITGYDDYYHKIDIPVDEVTFNVAEAGGNMVETNVEDGAGGFQGNVLKPATVGNVFVSASWNGLSAVTSIESMAAASLTPNSKSIYLAQPGQSATVSVSGLSPDGFTAPASGGLTYRLSDNSIGSMSGNVFTAAQEGTAYIQCSLGNASCYIPVSVGGNAKVVHSFEGLGGLKFSCYPKLGITGNVGLSNTYYNDGKNSLELNYAFSNATDTQAAYLEFEKGFKIPGEPSAIKMSVYGNNSGQWLRSKAHDARGKEITLDFTKDINWEGAWKELSASVPSGTAYPITIDNIYTAALSNTDTSVKALYFDKLMGVYPNNVVNVPAATAIPDKKQGTVKKADDGSYYINVIGTVSSGTVKNKNLYNSERAKAKGAVEKETNLAVYGGKTDIAMGINGIKWTAGYQFYNKPSTSIVQLTAAKGGLRSTGAAQWIRFKNDIMNAGNPNVIFIMDKTPSDFNDPMEIALFRSVLNDIRKEGKNVFVVSTAGTGYWSTIKEGIRYVNLPDLWTAGGGLNQNFRMLKFRVNGNDITYETVKMY